jgi:micrococcal nuclease
MYEYKAQIEKIVDGDTMHLVVDLGIDLSVRLTVRIAGINCPEMSTDEGKAAKLYAEEVLLGGIKVLRTIKDRKEKYGRYLGQLELPDGQDFGVVMINAGHAVPYP